MNNWHTENHTLLFTAANVCELSFNSTFAPVHPPRTIIFAGRGKDTCHFQSCQIFAKSLWNVQFQYEWRLLHQQMKHARVPITVLCIILSTYCTYVTPISYCKNWPEAWISCFSLLMKTSCSCPETRQSLIFNRVSTIYHYLTFFFF